MLYSIKNVEDLQKLNELISLKNQVQEVRLQGRLDEQIYHEDAKKLFRPMTEELKKFLKK